MNRIIRVLVLCFSTLSSGLSCQVLGGTDSAAERITLATIPMDWDLEAEEIETSPDGNAIAFKLKGTAGERVVANGVPGKLFDKVSYLAWNNHFSQLAYRAQRGESWFIVLGKETYGPYKAVGPPRFQAKTNKLHFLAVNEKGAHLIIDGVASRLPYDGARELVLSQDGLQFAFVAIDSNLQWVVLNGKEGEPYYRVGRLTFSPGGERFAYTTDDHGRSSVVVDGKEGPEFDDVGIPVFSGPDRRVSIAGRMKGKWVIATYAKGWEIRNMPNHVSYPTYSASGGTLAFISWTDQGAAIQCGSQVYERHTWVSCPVHVDSGNRIAFLSASKGLYRVHLGPTTLGPFDWVGHLRVNNRSKVMTFVTVQQKKVVFYRVPL